MRSKQLQAIRYFTTKIAPKNFAYSESELRSYYDVILVGVGGTRPKRSGIAKVGLANVTMIHKKIP